MKFFLNSAFTCILVAITVNATAQKTYKGTIIDSHTKEILPGATVIATGTTYGTITDINGKFNFVSDVYSDSVTASFIGYKKQTLKWNDNLIISLTPSSVQLDQIIVSASRDVQERKEAPVAITSVTPQVINETKATSLEQVLNKVHGVYMVDLGNEQHSMSIRQPLSYGSLFLYMEDGIPLRTTGIFNHNALIEMNMASVRNMEIIKGPASSMYGSEAIGGAVNFITHRPSLIPVAKLQLQANNAGYRRTDLMVSDTWNKFGVAASGYLAKRNNGPRDHSDFDKIALTIRTDLKLSDKTNWTNSVSHIDYETDMTGGLDSTNFFSGNFTSMHTFTSRIVKAQRFRSTLEQYWNNKTKSTLSAIVRDNSIKQNPNYRVKDDYKPWNNSGNKLLAHGEINESSFNSYGLIAQHKHGLNFWNMSITAGASGEFSPSDYYAKYIRINKNAEGIYTDYIETDSLLSNYSVNIKNTAIYTQVEFVPVKKLKVTASARYDMISYDYNNHLTPNAFSGAPDGKSNYSHLTPKTGFTYELAKGTGVYANYAIGFTPPDVTELYRGVKIPSLRPSTYTNYEAGGWLAFASGKGLIEVSIYQLDGTNEIVNVKQPDGSYENQNAGETQHKGVEYSVKFSPANDVTVRFSGANAHHTYIHFEPRGDVYSGNAMVNAPHFIANSEITYRPTFLPGLRFGLEWQHMGEYYIDEGNTEKYPGFNLFNIRAGYEFKKFEIWFNTLNVTDELYATIANKSAWGKSYRVGESRTFNLGMAINLNGK